MKLHHRPKATMNYGVAVLFLFFLAAEAKVARLSSCGFPNATDVKPNIFSCNTEAPIQVSEVHIRDPSGKDIYPIDPKLPIVLDLTAVNHGVQYNDDKANVKLYEYAGNWLTGECSWQEIPTFGLLNNIDGCETAHNCPLKPGPLDLGLNLDLSKYAAIISLLASHVGSQ
uniref:Phosphatidylglycerol/phosphatidylinositol transfer protein n=1 Tax=Steinernema glaseri TaxID=37863 RepID=A0A1I8A9Q2_9BILA